MHDEVRARAEDAARLRQQAVERAQYEADLAQRRYLRADPDNRLVAGVLEGEWNEKLRALEAARETAERQRQADEAQLSAVERAALLALPGDFAQLVHPARPPPEMHADDAGGARRNQSLDAGRIDRVGRGVHVAEDGGDALPLERVRGGDEGEGGDDHLLRQSGRANGDLQGDRTVANDDAVRRAGQLADPPLEFLHVGPVVGEPAPVEEIVDPLQQARPIADVGATDVEQLGKGGGAAEDREVRQRGLHAISSPARTPARAGAW